MSARRRTPGEGSIYQRKDRKWIATIETGDRFGPRRRRYFVGKTREAVRQKLLTAQRAGIARGSDEIITVSDLLDEWLATSERTCAHRTYRSYLDMAEAFFRPSLGPIHLSRLTANDIERAARAWARSAPRRKGLSGPTSPKTLANRLSGLRTALAMAVKQHLIPWNPASAVPLPRVPPFAAKILTPEQFLRLLRAANTRFLGDYRAHVLVAAAAGLRRGEICALTWGDLDGDVLTVGKAIEIRRPKPYTLAEKPPKNNRIERVALPEIVVDALALHRAAQARRLVGVDARTRIFDDNGQTLNPDKLGRVFRRIRANAKVPNVRLHDLRHSFGTWMTDEGVPTRVVQKQMRHADARSTERYTRNVDIGARKAAKVLGDLLRNAMTEHDG